MTEKLDSESATPVGRALGRSLGRQSVVVFAGLAFSIALGIAAQSYLASQLGTSTLADVFYLGTAVPTLMATALLGSTSNALIRYATDTPSVLDPRSSGSTGRRLFQIAASFSGILAALGVALWAGLVQYDSSSVSGGLGRFLLVSSPVPVLIGAAALGSVIALARKEFVRASWGGAVNGACLVIAIVVMGEAFGGLSPTRLALAVDIGYIGQLLFVTKAFRHLKGDGVPPTGDITKVATRGVLLLLASSAVYKSQPLVERSVGASLETGVPAALGYADKITTGLMQLAVFGFAVAALPSLSQELASRDFAGAAARLRAALYGTATATMIVVAFALSSAGDMVRILYEHGNFSATSAQLTEQLVRWALPSIAFGALASPLVAVAYANKKVREVVGIGLLGFVSGTTATILFASWFGPEGIVAGTGVGYALTFLAFAARVKTTLRDWSWSTFFGDFWVTGVLVAAALVPAFFLARLVPLDGTDQVMYLLPLIGVRLGISAAAGVGALLVAQRVSHRMRGRRVAEVAREGT
jgi:putative peptidoglycan lipid II flippase